MKEGRPQRLSEMAVERVRNRRCSFAPKSRREVIDAPRVSRSDPSHQVDAASMPNRTSQYRLE